MGPILSGSGGKTLATMTHWGACKFLGILLCLWTSSIAIADSSSPRLGAYYDRKMVVCGTEAYQWSGTERPRQVSDNVAQVGVGADSSYVLSTSGALMHWRDDPSDQQKLMDGINWFAAGDSGVFALDRADTLWLLERGSSWFSSGKFPKPMVIAKAVSTASIGDSANYYVTKSGDLYVKGLAHRGQYGDGKLKASDKFIPVAENVAAIKAHTGHAILQTRKGAVLGTGGNIFGPLGRHGLGDKATIWGKIFEVDPVTSAAIATGSSHSVAIDTKGVLWAWGRGIGMDPVKKMDAVVAVAADRSGTIALKADNTLWQWNRGQQPQLHFSCP